MLNGLMVLGGLCITVICGAELATQDNKQTDLDFYEFYDLQKPSSTPVPKEKFQLTLIQGGKANQKRSISDSIKKI